MSRRLAAAAALCLVLLMMLVGCGEKEDAFAQNKARMVGTWRMTAYTDGDGNTYDFTDRAVLFTYNADGTGEKTVAGAVEYTLTYSYDGEHLYTTAAYPDTGRVQMRNDLCTATADTLTVFSYDENATITLVRAEK